MLKSHQSLCFCLLAAAFLAGCGRPQSPEISLRWNDQPPYHQVEVVGLPDELVAAVGAVMLQRINSDEWNRILALYVVPEVATDSGDSSVAEVPMLGRHFVGIKEPPPLAFQPQFPLRPGMKYRARFDPAALVSLAGMDDSTAKRFALKAIELEFETPAPPPAPPTTVSAIYPSSNVLPENQLKFYIHFSAPMSRGEAYERVRLEKASGEVVPIPFLELSEELWDVDGKRFTIFFEPGRVKRGVMLREEIGPALVAGGEYVLVVDGKWRDAHGNPLGEDFRKPFRTSPQDETQPNPHEWKLTAPAAGSREPLVIEFNEPLDQAMLHRVISIVSADGSETAGEVRVDRGETRWHFTPDETWAAGKHELVVAGVLEDLAGNSVGRRFEVRLEDRDQKVLKEVRLPFSTR